MADDAAKIEISDSSSRLDAGLRAAATATKRWALSVQAEIAKISVRGAGMMARFAGGMAHNLGGRGMDFVADQAKSVKTFEESLVRLQIAGSMTTQKGEEIGRA